MQISGVPGSSVGYTVAGPGSMQEGPCCCPGETERRHGKQNETVGRLFTGTTHRVSRAAAPAPSRTTGSGWLRSTSSTSSSPLQLAGPGRRRAGGCTGCGKLDGAQPTLPPEEEARTQPGADAGEPFRARSQSLLRPSLRQLKLMPCSARLSSRSCDGSLCRRSGLRDGREDAFCRGRRDEAS